MRAFADNQAFCDYTEAQFYEAAQKNLDESFRGRRSPLLAASRVAIDTRSQMPELIGAALLSRDESYGPVLDLDASRFDVIFTGIESEPAKMLEPLYAKQCPVLSTASAFRYEDDVPVLIPAVNDDHIALLDAQRQQRGWQGFITPQPNCTTLGAAITLAPIATHFGIETVVMTSLQAVSGSGRNGGVLSLDIVDNVIPYISGEEEKVQREVGKVLGQCTANGIVPADLRMSATCTRVPVIDGHTESILVITKQKTDVAETRAALEHFGQDFVQLGLPSSPEQFIVVHDDPFRPQPRLDRDTDDGMATVVGRLRADMAFENGMQYVLVSHNTKMGAAKGSVLTAELLAQKGYIGA
ncbi:aspartate-semialdehyde dehydrogenase [Candidatus Entotheonella serta]|nr:aspartate-semialdehyde dehydrogenase [Candidatus Entotheonella serta]